MGQYSKNPDASNPNQDKSYYPDGSTTLSMANNGYEKEQITRATIGSGIINITNNNNNQTQDITSLNRDINKNQEITKDTITGALNVQTTIDNRIIGAIIGNEGAQDSLVKTITGAASNFKKTLNQLLRADKIVLNAGIIVSDMIGANNMKDSFQHQNNINDAYVNAAFESISDNFSGNTENSSFTGILKTNKGIVDSIESTQKDPELTIGLNSLTSLTPKEIIDILQQAADNNDQYSNNDTHDGQIILYQDNNNITGTYAFAYDNTDDKNRIDNNDPIIKTINLNLAGIDITNSGEVINAIYHEGTNFKTHTNNEQEAHRGGSFAQDLWESNSIVNNYQNLNQITANQYNQIYNSSNNQDIAIGNEVSYVQHVYDNENVNDYLYLMDRKIPFTEWARTKDVEDFDLNFGVQGVVTRVYASFGTDGFSVGADLNPSVGIGVYSNIVPRGENVEYSVVFGFKNSLTGSAGTIITDKGNFGITGSYGLSIPFYPIPTNVSRTIPLDKLKQDSK